MIISVIGGDLRQITLASLLKKEGYTIKIFGFDKNIEENALRKAANISDAANADIIILPLPVSHDNLTLNMPFSKNSVTFKDFFEKLYPNSLIFGGKPTDSFKDALFKKNIIFHDYFDREELSISNAIPTAEGAIELALSETPHTLHKSNCLVIGYGRIGKILADRLKAFGANVTVSARKCSDFAWIEANNYNVADSRNLEGKIKDFQIIFNTVPSMILDKSLLAEIPKNTLIIDLASKPGGVNFELAKELGLKVIWALSLPGKVAPVTSGEIIKNTIINIINETEGL